ESAKKNSRSPSHILSTVGILSRSSGLTESLQSTTRSSGHVIIGAQLVETQVSAIGSPYGGASPEPTYCQLKLTTSSMVANEFSELFGSTMVITTPSLPMT